MFSVHFAFMNGTLSELIEMQAKKLIEQYPNMSQASAMGYAGAIIGRIAEEENQRLTMDARRSDSEIDDLYYWLKEESPCYIVGAIAELCGSRSLLQDMAELETLLENLKNEEWDYTNLDKKLIAPEFKTWLANHK